MTKEELTEILEQGENANVEFKQSFNRAVIETLVAFSNTKGGKVIIGVNDNKIVLGVSITEETIQKWVNEIKQNTEPAIIPDIDITKINNKNVIVLTVIEYPVKPVSYKNKYYKRVQNSNHKMSLTEVANEHLRTINGSWDYYPDPNHNLEHISITKIEKYIADYEIWNKTKVSYKPIEFLAKQEILKKGTLSFGAYILFAKELCIVSDIQIGRFKSPTKIIDSINLDTDIFTELDEIIAFITKHLMVEFIITGNPQREERYDYPLDAIREIVINMLIHRDYRDSSGSIIKIYDDRIEFYNPGGLYGDLTKEKLLEFNYQPQARNKMLAKAFKLIGKVEKYGSGMKRIFNICKNYGVIPPEINISENGFELILYKQKINVPLNVPLNNRQKEILKEILKTNKITQLELASIYNVNEKTIKRDLQYLQENNIIERIGSKKTGYWEITKK